MHGEQHTESVSAIPSLILCAVHHVLFSFNKEDCNTRNCGDCPDNTMPDCSISLCGFQLKICQVATSSMYITVIKMSRNITVQPPLRGLLLTLYETMSLAVSSFVRILRPLLTHCTLPLLCCRLTQPDAAYLHRSLGPSQATTSTQRAPFILTDSFLMSQDSCMAAAPCPAHHNVGNSTCHISNILIVVTGVCSL